jgi:hypothetical protein
VLAAREATTLVDRVLQVLLTGLMIGIIELTHRTWDPV